MCDKVVSEDPFMLKYCLDRYNTQKMCDKAVDAFQPALKFVPGWLVTSKLIKKLDDTVFANDDKVFFDEGSDNVTIFSDVIDILSEYLNNINFVHNNVNEDGPETIIHVRLMTLRNRFKQLRAFLKINQLTF